MLRGLLWCMKFSKAILNESEFIAEADSPCYSQVSGSSCSVP